MFKFFINSFKNENLKENENVFLEYPCELLKLDLIEMEWDILSMRWHHGLIDFLLESSMISQQKSHLISHQYLNSISEYSQL